MHPTVNIAVRAARKAGEIISRSLDKMDSIKIEEKSHNNFVTEIDKAAEQAIIHTLSTAFPTHSFLSEEAGEIIKEDAEHIWIIDPLDGTTNFIHGYPHYAVSIALQIQGRIEHGVIYNPISNQLFTATRGQGAQLNGKRMRVGTRNKLDQALLSTGTPRNPAQMQQFIRTYESMHSSIAGMRHSGSTTLDLAYVAAGFLDAYWHRDTQPWDMAAGVLLVREAGGLVTDIEGGTEFMSKRSIVASNPKLLKPLLQTLRD